MNATGISLIALALCFAALAALYLVLSLKQRMFEHVPLLVVLTGIMAIFMGLPFVFFMRVGAYDGLLWVAGIGLAFVAFAFACLAIEVRAV